MTVTPGSNWRTYPEALKMDMLPYGRQCVEDDDIAAVVSVLTSDWLTTGPAVDAFEQAVSAFVGVKHGVAVASGTAALHAAMHALGIGPGDEVIVPSMTFAATANAVVYTGGTPVFTDVVAETLLLDPIEVQKRVTPRTKAIVSVDYAGQPCDYKSLIAIARQHSIPLVADACHALGGRYQDLPIGSIADMTAFSFHPVKHITTGEGGMVVTDNPEFAGRMRTFRNHGITTDHRQRAEAGAWSYEMVELGFNYRISDIQCALGLSQLRKLPGWIDRRRQIAARYDQAFAGHQSIHPLAVLPEGNHAYHLYVVRVGSGRQAVFQKLRERGIGVNVHYIPVHLHPFYRKHFGTGPGLCPVAERAYEEIISLPMFPKMADSDIDRVISELLDVVP